MNWRARLAQRSCIQRGMSGIGATIAASRKFFTRNEFKAAFADEIALKQWHREINAIIVQATGKPPTGSIDDGQEVGKGH
jgi:hypothetical protein